MGKSHLLEEPGSIQPISWHIFTPAENGRCQIALIDNLDYNFREVLPPTDGSADEDGWFPCGNKVVYSETVDVVFPELLCE